jgi:hypothetical protein
MNTRMSARRGRPSGALLDSQSSGPVDNWSEEEVR